MTLCARSLNWKWTAARRPAPTGYNARGYNTDTDTDANRGECQRDNGRDRQDQRDQSLANETTEAHGTTPPASGPTRPAAMISA
jgi:hypothetical protein